MIMSTTAPNTPLRAVYSQRQVVFGREELSLLSLGLLHDNHGLQKSAPRINT
jgi:hypothetical protein